MTPEQQAAQEELQRALERHVKAFKPDMSDGELLVDWACIAQLTRFNEQGNRESAYQLIYANGAMEEHRAKGLFYHALHLVDFGELE